jgi:HicA-like toxin of HicAB toxin-antitoxin system
MCLHCKTTASRFLRMILRPSSLQYDEAARHLESECVSALLKLGFQFKRQHGSHIILRRENRLLRQSYQIIQNWTPGRCARYCDKQVLTAEQFLSLL